MNYRSEFEACFDFIEAHLKEQLTVKGIAKEMSYSIYHFCRIFYAYQGMTPMEYVQFRRLQATLMELCEGRKVIDIACDYGFETASGFSKAFRNKYGMTPSQMKAKMLMLQKNDTKIVLEDLPITYVQKEIQDFYVCGYCQELDYDCENYADNMVAYWDNYEDNNIEERLYEELNPNKHGEIGIIIRDGLNSTEHKYLLGVMAQDKTCDTVWFNYKISAGKYVVITTPPVDMTCNDTDFAKMIKKVWKYIFNKWFESVGFEYDESREAFEYYDERCHYRKDSVMDIYIPIK